MDKAFTNHHIEERSYVSYIKREIHMEAGRSHFDSRKIAEIDIIVSELTSNLIKHVGSGEVLYRFTDTGPEDSTFEILCIDKGQGIAELAKMMKDGASTTGTLGQGLGAIERLSTFSQVYSIPGWGTVIYSLVSTQEKKFIRKTFPDLEIRGICVNKPREGVCGDGYRVKRTENEIMFFLGDGLGHGEHAKAAVDTAGEFFFECSETGPVEIIRQMHEKVRRTRGLVIAVAAFDQRESIWRICGVGNIAVRLYNGIQYKNYMSYNGTVGMNIPNSMKESTFPIEKNQHLMMCSDGIRSRWDLTLFPSIFKYDNSILGAALYRDFTRGNDDSSVLIAKVI